jgi:tRNA threonylcarbamoyladenosine biosynthesis protein TsaB
VAAPLLLAFDTSGPWCAAALARGPAVLGLRAETMERGQAERLVDMLGEVLGEARLGWADLGAVACGIGPGNLTGVRISVAAARALALALRVPALGVSIFEAAAEEAERPCLVALDARRGESWFQRFGEGAEGPGTAVAGAALPVEGCASLIGDAPGLAGTVPPAQPLPAPAELVRRMAGIAAGRLGTPAARPAPLYLRPADAAPPREPPPAILP